MNGGGVLNASVLLPLLQRAGRRLFLFLVASRFASLSSLLIFKEKIKNLQPAISHSRPCRHSFHPL